MKKAINWARKNKTEFFLLLIILLTGTFLRFHQIRGHATFLGDEGRDAIVVKRMIVDRKFTLLGPTVSFGNLYLGPIYYYFMILPLWLANFDPVGPAVMVALFGILAIFLIWKMAYEFFGKVAAFTAASLYAVSQVVIVHTRSSWNPNPMPFFALLAFWGLYRTIKDQEGKWLILVGTSLGIALQLHFIALVLIASIFFIFLICRVKLAWRWYMFGLVSFFLPLLPQILFEIRHQFVLSRAMLDFFLKRGEFVATAGVGFGRIAPFSLYLRLFKRLIGTDIQWLGGLIGIVSGSLGILFLLQEGAFKTKNLGLLMLLLWILFGVFGVSFYQGQIHDHYLGFLFPTPFLLFSFTISRLWREKIGKFMAILFTFFLLGLNLKKTNVFSKVGPNYQIERTRIVARTIAEDVGERKFNLALVSPTGDFMAMNYRYFLELFKKRAEDYGNFENIDVLYVIEEAKRINPEQLDLWEVKTFGPFQTVRDWNFDFQVTVYRLEHQK